MILEDCVQFEGIFENIYRKRVGIVTHENPDGDGLPASIALFFCLREIYGARPLIMMDSAFPAYLDFLPYKRCRILSYQSYIQKFKKKFDLLIVLDCHDMKRIDCDVKLFDISHKVLFIDHHIAAESRFLRFNDYYIDAAATSTGLIIHRFFYDKIKNYLNQYTDTTKDWINIYADCIYTTIINDTDNFINSNMNPETFSTITDLIRLGLKPHIIANQFLNRKSIYYFRFVGQVLSTIEIRSNLAIYHSTQKMLAENHQTTEAYSKMMRWTKGALDIKIQIFLGEYENNLWRISLRSEKNDVAKIAKYFAGGGHKRAAGFKMTGDLESIKNKIITYIEKHIK